MALYTLKFSQITLSGHVPMKLSPLYLSLYNIACAAFVIIFFMLKLSILTVLIPIFL